MKNSIRMTLCVIAVVLLSTGCDRSPGTAALGGATGQGKILYYRNPMGQPDTSATPKKDSMGMDYIPVYADEKL